MHFISLAFGLALGTCPQFVEILPDPSEVEDSRGEFVEIRLPHEAWRDTVSVFHEQKKVFSGKVPDFANRILLIRDTTLCPHTSRLFCDMLEGAALANSREDLWTLSSGACVDTARLPVPKPGRSLVRTDTAFFAWTLSSPTPGLPDAKFETGVNDCRLEIDTLRYEAFRWTGKWTLSGCDSARVAFRFRAVDSFRETAWEETLRKNVRTRFDVRLDAKALEIFAAWSADDVFGNDSLDTLVFRPGGFPVRFTEVHPCPEEGVPEWMEIYNGGLREVSLGKMNLCVTKRTEIPDVTLQSRESAILVKDTAAMRSFVGTDDVQIIPVNFGYLKNAADSLYLCYGTVRADSVFWGKLEKIQPDCPSGFSTSTGRKENSPGFQTPGSLEKTADGEIPFAVKWNARIFSKRNRANPLMVSVRSEKNVLVELISGRGDLLWKKRLEADAGGNVWIRVPLLEKGFPGPNFLRFSVENHEKRVGVILRP